jgi:DNA-directed RNA polymerase specialized sigma24 family protein
VPEKKERQTVDSGAAFAALLPALDADTDAAALRFERIRGRLLRFFRARGGQWPDELADETLDRVGRRLSEGQSIADVDRYVLGVARHVLLETWRHERRHPTEDDFEGAVARVAAPARETAEETEAGLRCLARCLDALPAEERELLFRYYTGEGRALVEARQVLAAELGLAQGALRIRLHRIRLRMEQAVRNCLQGRETSGPLRPHSSRGRRP